MFLGLHLLVQLLVLHLWNSTGRIFAIQGTAVGATALPAAGMAAVALWLCLAVLRSFPAGAPLRSAWMLFTLAAAAKAGSGVLGQLLGTSWLLNPLVWTGHATPGLLANAQHFAVLAGGPLRLVLLAAAMLAVLRMLWKFGFWERPSAADQAVFAIFCLFTLCRFSVAGAATVKGSRVGFEEWVSLAGLLVLCVLFLEAMLLRQAVGRMGRGPIARVWLALVWGVMLTGAGEAILWAIPYCPQSLMLPGFLALIQLPMAAAFALVPACQVAAQCQAIKPAGSRSQDLAKRVPALAR
jgi:hypothetical protein